jgi:hypothetical protein
VIASNPIQVSSPSSYPELLYPHALFLPLEISQQSAHKTKQEPKRRWKVKKFIRRHQNTTMEREPLLSSLFSLK